MTKRYVLQQFYASCHKYVSELDELHQISSIIITITPSKFSFTITLCQKSRITIIFQVVINCK